ncbi:protein phosphatase CheZ [Sulfuriferula sp. AH1]|uniref:protein phosphatase CheZ n=1 Tax=Sulfuriferula sp. AH1 TaxID=1985873 RepID=UPI001CB9ACA4|nr:protein phosphatase CheZ [Sulfuriferula sp. AH1]
MMGNTNDDLEALFDEISSQRTEVTAQTITFAELSPYGEASPDVIQENQADIPMFDRLGAIVRQLHDSLNELGYDRTLAEVAEEITDSKSRLEYVATLTEQAANKVLNAIDEGMPVQDELLKSAKEIDTGWTLLFAGKLSIEEFKVLAGDSRQFATRVASATEAEKARLMDIMMAQDFQDITGQIIKKVITISQKLEIELAQLLRDNAPAEFKEKEKGKEKDKPVDLMAGPAVPASAMQQDDVDDLLADLGF